MLKAFLTLAALGAVGVTTTACVPKAPAAASIKSTDDDRRRDGLSQLVQEIDQFLGYAGDANGTPFTDAASIDDAYGEARRLETANDYDGSSALDAAAIASRLGAIRSAAAATLQQLGAGAANAAAAAGVQAATPTTKTSAQPPASPTGPIANKHHKPAKVGYVCADIADPEKCKAHILKEQAVNPSETAASDAWARQAQLDTIRAANDPAFAAEQEAAVQRHQNEPLTP